MDVLNFHLVIPLPTGPFVACEAVVLGKDARKFGRILTRFIEDLGGYGADAKHIRFVVSDMALPFAIAVIDVFNKIELPEYMATILFSAKAKDKRILEHNVKALLVWCGFHADRAMRRYSKDMLEGNPREVIEMMTPFSRILGWLSCRLVTLKSFACL